MYSVMTKKIYSLKILMHFFSAPRKPVIKIMFIQPTTQGPHKMEAKKTVVKMMVVEFQNNFMNSSFCSLCC